MTGLPLVTGATGFAGRHLLAALTQHGPVHAWGRPGGHPIPDASPDVVRWRAVDLLDSEAVRNAIAADRPSAIYHCAGIADVHGAWRGAAPALRVNVIGTARLLDAVAAAGLSCRVLITGSALVYRRSAAPIRESDPLGPSSPYGVSKLAQEMTAEGSALPIVLARSFNHAGPGQDAAFVTSAFARQIAEMEAGQREPVLRVGNLDARRDITDVRDTVRAYVMLTARGRPHRPYNVCSGRGVRVGDLLDLLLTRTTIRVRVEIDPERLRPSDNPVVVGNPKRIEEEVGWRAELPIERTLGDLLDYWRAAMRAGR